MSNEQVLDKVSTLLNNGQLNVLAVAVNDFEVTEDNITQAQGYLQGVLETVRLITNLTDEDINAIPVELSNDPQMATTDLVFHHIY